jgi:hypothetical protein
MQRRNDNNETETLKPAQIVQLIHVIRGEKILLDADLAKLYGTTTSRLNEAVKRNRKRFPSDFMFQLTKEEFVQHISSMSQNAISNKRTNQRGGRQKLPFAFTEQGVAMLSGVLQSDRAIEVNLAIMRAFVKLREVLSSTLDVHNKIETLAKMLDATASQTHANTSQIQTIFEIIRQLISPDTESNDDAPSLEKEKFPTGFRLKSGNGS